MTGKTKEVDNRVRLSGAKAPFPGLGRIRAKVRIEFPRGVSVPEGALGTLKILDGINLAVVHWDGLDGPPLRCEPFMIEDLETDAPSPRPSEVAIADKLRGWAERARSAQVSLDLDKDSNNVAIRAGQLLDLAEDIERARQSLLSRPSSAGAAALAGRALQERTAIVAWLRAGEANQPLLRIVADGIEAGQHLKGEG